MSQFGSRRSSARSGLGHAKPRARALRVPRLHVAVRAVDNATDTSSAADDQVSTEAAGSDAFSVGIDLGTTNSVAAIVFPGNSEPFLVPVEEGDADYKLPSVVSFKGEDNFLVGASARARAVRDPANTFHSVKRIIGQEFTQVEKATRRLSYSVVTDPDNAACLACEHAEGGLLYPEEVSTRVISTLLGAVERETGVAPTRAVISVPAYFGEEQREATVSAAEMAGLEAVKLIKEPVAAAFAYGIDLAEDATVLVLDLGGGTFDVSILEVGHGVVEVLSTGGDASLGGDDWDAAIAAHIEREALRPSGVDAAADPRLRAQLRTAAERAKIALSDAERVGVRVPLGGAPGGAREVVLTRTLLDDLAGDLYRRLRLPVDVACWQAGVDLGTVRAASDGGARRGAGRTGAAFTPKRRQPVKEVLLVGGATRMPAVRRFVHNMTGIEPRPEVVDPDAAVAAGAAIYAGVLSGHITDLMVIDVWQAALMRALATDVLSQDDDLRERLLGSEADELVAGARPGQGSEVEDDMVPEEGLGGSLEWGVKPEPCEGSSKGVAAAA